MLLFKERSRVVRPPAENQPTARNSGNVWLTFTCAPDAVSRSHRESGITADLRRVRKDCTTAHWLAGRARNGPATRPERDRRKKRSSVCAGETAASARSQVSCPSRPGSGAEIPVVSGRSPLLSRIPGSLPRSQPRKECFSSPALRLVSAPLTRPLKKYPAPFGPTT